MTANRELIGEVKSKERVYLGSTRPRYLKNKELKSGLIAWARESTEEVYDERLLHILDGDSGKFTRLPRESREIFEVGPSACYGHLAIPSSECTFDLGLFSIGGFVVGFLMEIKEQEQRIPKPFILYAAEMGTPLIRKVPGGSMTFKLLAANVKSLLARHLTTDIRSWMTSSNGRVR